LVLLIMFMLFLLHWPCIPASLAGTLPPMAASCGPISDEESARAALLLEAAAYELLRCQPASTRKAAFQLVLAGLRYHTAKQKRLATHCYMQVGAVTWRINGSCHPDVCVMCQREQQPAGLSLWCVWLHG